MNKSKELDSNKLEVTQNALITEGVTRQIHHITMLDEFDEVKTTPIPWHLIIGGILLPFIIMLFVIESRVTSSEIAIAVTSVIVLIAMINIGMLSGEKAPHSFKVHFPEIAITFTSNELISIKNKYKEIQKAMEAGYQRNLSLSK